MIPTIGDLCAIVDEYRAAQAEVEAQFSARLQRMLCGAPSQVAAVFVEIRQEVEHLPILPIASAAALPSAGSPGMAQEAPAAPAGDPERAPEAPGDYLCPVCGKVGQKYKHLNRCWECQRAFWRQRNTQKRAASTSSPPGAPAGACAGCGVPISATATWCKRCTGYLGVKARQGSPVPVNGSAPAPQAAATEPVPLALSQEAPGDGSEEGPDDEQGDEQGEGPLPALVGDVSIRPDEPEQSGYEGKAAAVAHALASGINTQAMARRGEFFIVCSPSGAVIAAISPEHQDAILEFVIRQGKNWFYKRGGGRLVGPVGRDQGAAA